MAKEKRSQIKFRIFSLLTLFIIFGLSHAVSQCDICKDAAKHFVEGMEKTHGKTFCGGDTSWHEERDIVYAKSEARFVEIIEKICAGSNSFKCGTFMEEHEEEFENWYYGEQEVPIFKDICVDKAKVCCEEGFYGGKCKACKGDPICNGHGKCDGDGTRGGNGKCKCTRGWKGDVCSECAEGFEYEKDKDECNNIKEREEKEQREKDEEERKKKEEEEKKNQKNPENKNENGENTDETDNDKSKQNEKEEL